MSNGPALLAELQAAGAADPSLDYETVMAELARGTSPMLALRPAQPAIGARVISTRLARLIDELVAIARAPFIPAESPESPPVPWRRLADDLRRTVGKVLDLAFRWEGYADGGYWMCDIKLDGSNIGGCRFGWDADDPEQSLADLADRLCEGWLHEKVWGGWPMCPRHATRPLWARVNVSGRAVWQCEADPADEVQIGQLSGSEPTSRNP